MLQEIQTTSIITIVFRIVIQYSANVSDLMQVNILLGTLSFLLDQI